MKLGVLALQGAFVEHIAVLRKLGVDAIEVRTKEDLAQVDGLILPGGESTTMSIIAERVGLLEPLRAWSRSGRPTFATCAGLILLANEVEGQKQQGQSLLGGLDIAVQRNFYGPQSASFEAPIFLSSCMASRSITSSSTSSSSSSSLSMASCCESSTSSSSSLSSSSSSSSSSQVSRLSGTFIRAPAIMSVGKDVQVLASIRHGSAEVVSVKQGNILGLCFHPELADADDYFWHRYFIEICERAKKTFTQKA
eukprot:TRINITY_DN1005_c0_g1_i3.p2 TRINITY_DN1005_c0_g1~~TRINITY_DN1005_c0_g1_i3.p2  ORF type:complete len:252 (+),score=74.25 TRINITY_DN1005_c0_g1_i3:53-808(+)